MGKYRKKMSDTVETTTTETPKEVVAETPKEVVEEKTEEVVSTNGTEAEKVEAKNGEVEAEKEVAETKEVVEKETEEVVSTNGTEAKEDVVEAKDGEAEATKDEDKNGHESDKEETHKDADMPMPSENGDAKTNVISERSDSMFSYPEFNDKDDQVIPGFFKHQNEHVDELSNQEVPKFGFEDCADVGNVSDEIDFYGDDSKTKKIVDVKNFEDDGRTLEIECCDEDFKKTIDAKNLTESKESNFEELMVTSNEVTGIPTMAGDGPKQLKRKQDANSDHYHTETEHGTNYHTLSGITMPKFLNGPPRIGLSKNKLCKSLHKKPKFVNK